ncbi:3-hydroxyisobutyrate dehydrogenase [Hahella sp. NBU794]|uniref:3-hydroxyisobutyrate dehydrogenase n=1 Tax=Hahella sp. NBU794 TaxID=3422590 RepID=UPI003D6F4153
MKTIGFIGLGHMGGPMAHNLLKAGFELRVFDLVKDAVSAAEKAGANACGSALEAAQGVDAVITMLPASEHSEAVYLGENGLLNQLSERPLLIDCSTIAPETSRRIAAEASKKGFAMLDAPVSGGTAGATAGTLTFIIGGSPQDLEKAQPALSAMGKNLFHAGDHGAGQAAKICNNMLLAVHMIGTAEALQLGVNLGLDPKVLSDIMLKSSGRNWSLELYNPYPGVMENAPAGREYEGGFAVNLMNKDLGLALEAAIQSRSSTPMGGLAKSLYQAHSRQGSGQLDFSSIQKLFADKT